MHSHANPTCLVHLALVPACGGAPMGPSALPKQPLLQQVRTLICMTYACILWRRRTGTQLGLGNVCTGSGVCVGAAIRTRARHRASGPSGAPAMQRSAEAGSSRPCKTGPRHQPASTASQQAPPASKRPRLVSARPPPATGLSVPIATPPPASPLERNRPCTLTWHCGIGWL